MLVIKRLLYKGNYIAAYFDWPMIKRNYSMCYRCGIHIEPIDFAVCKIFVDKKNYIHQKYNQKFNSTFISGGRGAKSITTDDSRIHLQCNSSWNKTAASPKRVSQHFRFLIISQKSWMISSWLLFIIQQSQLVNLFYNNCPSFILGFQYFQRKSVSPT